MPLYLAATPDRLAQCQSHTTYLVHMAYRIAEDGTLHSQPMPLSLRGGLMMLSFAGNPPGESDALCRTLLQLCLQRKFAGIVLDDDERSANGCRLAFAAKLERMLLAYHRRLIVPRSYAGAVEQSSILVCTALSGGSLHQVLEEACTQYGAERIVLDLQRLAMGFSLPCPSGEGQWMTLQELRQTMSGRAVFFSEELCTRYFTVHRGGHTQFILFDDARTLQRKWQLGQQLGIKDALVMLPETEDLLEALFEEKERS